MTLLLHPDANANSFVDLAGASTMLALEPFTESWDALTDSEKESYLIYATRIITSLVVWRGTRADADHRLPFPRSGLVDPITGNELAESTPVDVQLATALLAAHSAAEGDVSGLPASAGIQSVNLQGVITVQFDAVTDSNGLPSRVKNLVLPYAYKVSSPEKPGGTVVFGVLQ